MKRYIKLFVLRIQEKSDTFNILYQSKSALINFKLNSLYRFNLVNVIINKLKDYTIINLKMYELSLTH